MKLLNNAEIDVDILSHYLKKRVGIQLICSHHVSLDSSSSLSRINLDFLEFLRSIQHFMQKFNLESYGKQSLYNLKNNWSSTEWTLRNSPFIKPAIELPWVLSVIRRTPFYFVICSPDWDQWHVLNLYAAFSDILNSQSSQISRWKFSNCTRGEGWIAEQMKSKLHRQIIIGATHIYS